MKPQSLKSLRKMPLGTKVRLIGKSLYTNGSFSAFLEEEEADDKRNRRQWSGCILLKIDEERKEYLFSLGTSLCQDSSLIEEQETLRTFFVGFDIAHLQVILQETLTREELLTHHHSAVRALGASL